MSINWRQSVRLKLRRQFKFHLAHSTEEILSALGSIDIFCRHRSQSDKKMKKSSISIDASRLYVFVNSMMEVILFFLLSFSWTSSDMNKSKARSFFIFHFPFPLFRSIFFCEWINHISRFNRQHSANFMTFFLLSFYWIFMENYFFLFWIGNGCRAFERKIWEKHQREILKVVKA